MEEVSKNCTDFRICLNLSCNKLKIDCYKHIGAPKTDVTTTKKLQGIYKTKRKKSQFNTIVS